MYVTLVGWEDEGTLVILAFISSCCYSQRVFLV